MGGGRGGVTRLRGSYQVNLFFFGRRRVDPPLKPSLGGGVTPPLSPSPRSGLGRREPRTPAARTERLEMELTGPLFQLCDRNLSTDNDCG